RRADSASRGGAQGGKRSRIDTRTRVEKKEDSSKPVRKKGWAKPKKKR
ncbi:MAG: hypothetical protein HFF40_11625, partial [Lawsonibacter sp.]|nr:hypothetical protein [Lawsonibacter sp.]